MKERIDIYKSCETYNYARNVELVMIKQIVETRFNKIQVTLCYELTNIDLRNIPSSQFIIELMIPENYTMEDIDTGKSIGEYRCETFKNNRFVLVGEVQPMECNCIVPIEISLNMVSDCNVDQDISIDYSSSIQVDKLLVNTAIGRVELRSIKTPEEVSFSTLAINTGNEITRNVGYL